MIRLLAFMAFLSACTSTAVSQDPDVPSPLAAPAPALWELSDNDTTIHIFGSIHALPKDLVWRTEEFDAAFAAADTFCVETDVDAKAREVIQITIDEGMYKDDDQLSNYLTAEEKEDLYEISEAVGILPISIELMKPWHAMLTLGAALGFKLGLDEASGVEFVLLPEARATGKKICEMESPIEHVTSISRLPMDVQVIVLTHEKEEFKDVDDLDVAFDMMRADLDEMVDDWVRGDVDAMEDEDILEEYGHIDFYNAILVKRNRSWIPRIEALLEEPGKKFIAVGAAHVAGPDSVIKMLRDKGYEVKGP